MFKNISTFFETAVSKMVVSNTKIMKSVCKTVSSLEILSNFICSSVVRDFEMVVSETVVSFFHLKYAREKFASSDIFCNFALCIRVA